MLETERIGVTCPICSATKFLTIPPNLNLLNQNGLVTIQIPAGVICPHSFLFFMDKHYGIRGYEKNAQGIEKQKVINFKEIPELLRGVNNSSLP